MTPAMRSYGNAKTQVVGHTIGQGKYDGTLGVLIVDWPDGL
jgi:hypothetical protein